MALAEIALDRQPTSRDRKRRRRERREFIKGVNGLRFSEATKQEAFEFANYCCERCGKKIELEAHHLLPIWFCLEFVPQAFLPLINHVINAEIICDDCHDEEHSEWPEKELESIIHYNEISKQIFGVPLIDL